MRRVLFLFLDGVGLGDADPNTNPLIMGVFPTLMRLTGGTALTHAAGRVRTTEADLVPLDARMGVKGRPQSATGQAALLSGLNAPAIVGEHYGPWPDDRVRQVLQRSNLFSAVRGAGLRALFANAYPPGFFDAVNRGKRLLSAIQFAAQESGLALLEHDDLAAGKALSVDYTNQSWRDQLGYADVPVYSAQEAGAVFWNLAGKYQFVLHDHWLTDVAGHHQDSAGAVADLETFDGFLEGLLTAADLDETLVIIASDHGNVEDCSHGRHTQNPALCMLIGNRQGLSVESMHCLYDVAPLVLRFLGVA